MYRRSDDAPREFRYPFRPTLLVVGGAPGGTQAVVGRGRGALKIIEADGARRMVSVRARGLGRAPLSVVAPLSLEIAQVRDRRRRQSGNVADRLWRWRGRPAS